MTDRDSTTTKPWEWNRHGDPRQLRHEANGLDYWVRQHRADAEKFRQCAAESEKSAAHYEEVAADYRRWADEAEVRKEQP